MYHPFFFLLVLIITNVCMYNWGFPVVAVLGLLHTLTCVIALCGCVFPRPLPGFFPSRCWTPAYRWNCLECLVKHESISKHYHQQPTYQVMRSVHQTRTAVVRRKSQKNLWFLSPTQASNQGQWWSYFLTQRLQSSQCFALMGCCKYTRRENDRWLFRRTFVHM